VFDAVTLASVQHLQALPSGAMAWAVAFSPDSETLAVSGQGDSMIATWDTTSWTNTGIPWAGPPTTRSLPSDSPAGTPAEPNNIATVAWSPDGHLLAGGTADGGIYLWDAKTGANVRTLTIAGDVYNIAFSPDSGSIVATYASADPLAGRAAVWSLADGTLRYDVSVDDDYGLPFAATFSHDGKLLATAGGKGQIRFWDAATGTQTGPPAFGDAGWVESLSFSPDDSVLVAAGTDGTVRLIDPVGRRQLGSSLPGGDSGSIAAVGPDGRVFVGYGDTRRAYAWDISLPSLEAHACSLAQRTLTQAEWDQYLPTRAYQPACSGQ
jgi:WD40 repeat protein